MGLSTALSRGTGDATWNYENGSGEEGSSHQRSMKRMGSQLGKEKSQNDSLGALMDVLSQMEGGRHKYSSSQS